MPKPNQKALSLPKGIYERFQYEKEHLKKINPDLEIGTFLALLLDSFKDSLRLMPRLQFLEPEGAEIQIFDRVASRLVIVRTKEGELMCDECNNNACLHVGFAMSHEHVQKAIVAGKIKKVHFKT